MFAEMVVWFCLRVMILWLITLLFYRWSCYEKLQWSIEKEWQTDKWSVKGKFRYKLLFFLLLFVFVAWNSLLSWSLYVNRFNDDSKNIPFRKNKYLWKYDKRYDKEKKWQNILSLIERWKEKKIVAIELRIDFKGKSEKRVKTILSRQIYA